MHSHLVAAIVAHPVQDVSSCHLSAAEAVNPQVMKMATEKMRVVGPELEMADHEVDVRADELVPALVILTGLFVAMVAASSAPVSQEVLQAKAPAQELQGCLRAILDRKPDAVAH